VKILYVVQAYGEGVVGGAESHCRMVAERMAQRGHDVAVVTSCARSYDDWSNHFEPGASTLNGVTVHRLPVDRPRDLDLFGPFSGRVLTGHKPVPLFVQEQWVLDQGPRVLDLSAWLADEAPSFDVVAFFPYLYYPTAVGLPALAGRTRTVLHTLAHDEPQFMLPVFDRVLAAADGLAFNVEEEAALVRRRIARTCPEAIVGIGTELNVTGDASRFRNRYGLGDDPYVVYVGRVDPAKGSDLLFSYFAEYKRRNPSPLRLVLMGEVLTEVPPLDDVVVAGFVDEQSRRDGMIAALASLHPSYFESFSMTLIEAWSLRVPVLVNARCDVLAGQVARSGGGFAFDGFGEFEAAMDLLQEDSSLGAQFAAAGRAYVEERYDWKRVLDRYEELLERVVA
jgi:glycosyltransferase involved in cell wall biosynthesis